jgi:hypothetical protein
MVIKAIDLNLMNGIRRSTVLRHPHRQGFPALSFGQNGAKTGLMAIPGEDKVHCRHEYLGIISCHCEDTLIHTFAS